MKCSYDLLDYPIPKEIRKGCVRISKYFQKTSQHELEKGNALKIKGNARVLFGIMIKISSNLKKRKKYF